MPKHEPEVLRAREMRCGVDSEEPRVSAMKIVTDEEFMRALRAWGIGRNLPPHPLTRHKDMI